MVKHAIFHEGHANKSADISLIKELIKHLNLDFQKIHSYGMGSKSNFFEKEDKNYQDFKQLLDTDQIDKALLIIDADNERDNNTYGGFENTKRELLVILEHLDIKKVCNIYISCDPNTKEGYLESLILASIPEAHKECIETFFACSQFESRDNAKAILNQIYKQAYPAAPYNFSHSNFNELKHKLEALFSL